MADGTKIEWSEATWNPITGCSVISPGCRNCYAMRLAGTRLRHHWSRAGLTEPSKRGPVWNGKISFNRDWLSQPRLWRRPRMIFVVAHGDLFHEGVLDEWIDEIFDVIRRCPWHTFQILTKRPDRMRAAIDRVGELPNVWLGVSVEDQKRAEERIDVLVDTPAVIRFLSCEPLLGPLYLFDWLGRPLGPRGSLQALPQLDWVIVGGESGKAEFCRPMKADWARLVRDQCVRAGVPFFFKQWGRFEEVYGVSYAIYRKSRELDGREWNELPEGVDHA